MWSGPLDDDVVDGETPAGLAALVDAQRSLLISVATGGPRIEDADITYKKRHRLLKTGLERHGVRLPFKWNSLWDWYGYYSGKLGSYAERRVYINNLADPALEQLEQLQMGPVITDWGEALETWVTLDRRVGEMKQQITRASTLDDLQDVGRRAREIIIAGVNLVFDTGMVPVGLEAPKASDAKSRLEYILNSLVSGNAHSELRKLMRAALELAQKVTHSDSITRVDAFAAAQATVLLIRTLAEMQDEATRRG